MTLESAQYVGLMAICLLLILLLIKILFYIRKQAEKVSKLDERLKLMENMETKEDEE